MIRLEFLSSDPEELALAERYWAMDSTGKFTSNVADLLPFRNASKTNQLPPILRNIARAFDLNQQCPSCGNYEQLTSRSQAKKQPTVMYRPCSRCQDEQAAALRKQSEDSEKQVHERLIVLQQQREEMTTDYSALPDDIALLTLALERTIDPRLRLSQFKCDDCRLLTPLYHDKFLHRLWNAKVIVDHPALAKRGAYFLKEGALWYTQNQVVFKLVPDTACGKSELLFDQLRARGFSPSPVIHELWLDHASAECMAYLHNQCEAHSMSLDEALDAAIHSVIRVTLTSYSIAKVWNLIWKIVRDAAALSTRDYYTRPKAAATIPGKLQRHLEKIARGEAVPLKAWDRPHWQPSGMLGQLFLELYGIDEITEGSEVMAAFSADRASDAQSIELAEIRQPANQLMRSALTQGIAANVLQELSTAIRDGLSLPEAIQLLFQQRPSLQ